MDISSAFKEVVDDFVSSAETEEHLSLFPMIGVTAWNLSYCTENQRAERIKVFINRFNCPTFTWKNTVAQTKEKILDLCNKKMQMYPELNQLIISLDIEGLEDGLKYTIVSKPID